MSTSPSLSFLIPTAGRVEIAATLASIVLQLEPQDEVIVIGDTLESPLEVSQQIVQGFGPQVRWLTYPGTEHTWGHAQLNYGISQARGEYLHCNDDDDLWTETAAASIRHGIEENPGQPLLFKFHSWHYYTYWDVYGLLEENHLGGHCLVAPNIPGKVGTWTDRYQGDFDYVVDTVALHGGPEHVVWRDEIICIARPSVEKRQQIVDAYRVHMAQLHPV